MGKRRFAAVLRKYGVGTTAIFSLIGIVSVFSVHLAGFFIVLPAGVRQMADTTAFSNLSTRFTILLALSLLAARFAPLLIGALISNFSSFFIILQLAVTSVGRRYIRRKGKLGFADYAQRLLRAKDDGGIDTERFLKWAYNSKAFINFAGTCFVFGKFSGAIGYKVERYTIPIQVLSVFIILSVVYVDFFAAASIIVFAIVLFFFFPPSFASVYLEYPYWARRLSPFMYLQIRPFQAVSIGKFVVMILSISFLLGYSHAKSLLGEKFRVATGDSLMEIVSVLVVTGSGVIVYSNEVGFSFRSFSRIDSIP